MALERLARAEWQRYCARISRNLAGGQRAELDLVSLGLGDRREASWVPLYGIAYDPKSDVFEIVLEGIDHMIAQPRDVLVETTARGVVALEIIGADDIRQIIKLSEPLAVPAA